MSAGQRTPAGEDRRYSGLLGVQRRWRVNASSRDIHRGECRRLAHVRGETNGTVACWGSNDHGQSTPPSGTFTEVSAGVFHTCGVKTNGTVACWGNNGDGQSTPPSGTFTAVSAGLFHTCGVKTDGTVACWGNRWRRPVNATIRDIHRGERRILSHVRGEDERDSRLLGKQWRGPGACGDAQPSHASLRHRRLLYSQTITASGGLAPYSFKKISGSLPVGLTFTTDGTLSGTPGSRGDFTFRVQAKDKNNIAGEKTYTLTVGYIDATPTLGTLTPSVLTSAADVAKSFGAVYSDADGYANMKLAYLKGWTSGKWDISRI